MKSFLPDFFVSLNMLNNDMPFLTSKRSLDLTLLDSCGDFDFRYFGEDLAWCLVARLDTRGVSRDSSNCGRLDSLVNVVNGGAKFVIRG